MGWKLDFVVRILKMANQISKSSSNYLALFWFRLKTLESVPLLLYHAASPATWEFLIYSG